METSCIEYRWLCSSFNGNFRKPIWAQFECSSVVLLLVALTTFGFPGSSRSSLLSADWASHPASLCWRKYVRKVRSHDNWISLGKRLYILRSTTIFPELELGHRVPDPDPAIVVIAIIGEKPPRASTPHRLSSIDTKIYVHIEDPVGLEEHHPIHDSKTPETYAAPRVSHSSSICQLLRTLVGRNGRDDFQLLQNSVGFVSQLQALFGCWTMSADGDSIRRRHSVRVSDVIFRSRKDVRAKAAGDAYSSFAYDTRTRTSID